ncbi:MAG: hypothetical protein QM569_09720 [Acidovorax sp.]|uniref:hypothetical protein n=1 Tax=Acidovorax sp. TaxID=1872122 RepID=UPI0039E606AC
MPTVGQAQRLICMTVLSMLRSACSEATEASDESGGEPEYQNPANAAELALEAVQRLMASLPCDVNDFSAAWWRAQSVAGLAADAYPDKDATAWRLLNGAVRQFKALHAVLERAGAE